MLLSLFGFKFDVIVGKKKEDRRGERSLSPLPPRSITPAGGVPAGAGMSDKSKNVEFSQLFPKLFPSSTWPPPRRNSILIIS